MNKIRSVTFFGCLATAILIISGCSSKPTTTDMPFLNNIPASQTKQIDDALSQVGYKFQEPTKLPFDVFYAQADVSKEFNLTHVSLMFVSKDKRAIVVEIDKGHMGQLEAMNKQSTKLSDGTQAIYANNGAVSQLFWEKDDITYSLASSKNENGKDGPDLTMIELVQVADSFK